MKLLFLNQTVFLQEVAWEDSRSCDKNLGQVGQVGQGFAGQGFSAKILAFSLLWTFSSTFSTAPAIALINSEMAQVRQADDAREQRIYYNNADGGRTESAVSLSPSTDNKSDEKKTQCITLCEGYIGKTTKGCPQIATHIGCEGICEKYSKDTHGGGLASLSFMSLLRINGVKNAPIVLMKLKKNLLENTI